MKKPGQGSLRKAMAVREVFPMDTAKGNQIKRLSADDTEEDESLNESVAVKLSVGLSSAFSLVWQETTTFPQEEEEGDIPDYTFPQLTLASGVIAIPKPAPIFFV